MFVLPSLSFGGAERQAFFLARYLREECQAEAQLLSLSSRDALADICNSSQVPFDFFELGHSYRSRLGQATDLARFIRLLRRQRVQILLPYCMFQNVLCGLTWRAGGARVCVWNQRDEGRSRLEPWVERLAVRQITRFISNSTHGADFVLNELGVPAEKVAVVPNGVLLPTLSSPKKDWRQALGLSSESFVACMVANLHSKKDHATLVTAWRHVVDQLAATNRPAHLLLAGAFHDTHEALVRQVAELSLEKHVHFLGQVHPVDDILLSVDLAVFSSVNEGMPNAVLEAMSHEVAVVATDYPGIREALGADGSSLLARAKDPQHLAEAILLAARDPLLRKELAQRGRARIAASFSVDHMAATMAALISSEWELATAMTRQSA